MGINNQKIGDFLQELSSRNPTPGGGAVAALVGAMAAGLVEMVAHLTKELGVQTKLRPAAGLRGKLLKLADEDCLAFEGVMFAYKQKDGEEIKKSLQMAIRVPREVKQLAVQVEKLAAVAVKQGNKNAASDAKTALYLSRAAQKSAEENIKINQQALARLK